MSQHFSFTLILSVLMAHSFLACESSQEEVRSSPQVENPVDEPDSPDNPTQQASEEVPDGIDNDLDGLVDEGLVVHPDEPPHSGPYPSEQEEYCDSLDNESDEAMHESLWNCENDPFEPEPDQVECQGFQISQEQVEEFQERSDGDLCAELGFSSYSDLCYNTEIPEDLAPDESGAILEVNPDCEYIELCLEGATTRTLTCLPFNHPLAVESECQGITHQNAEASLEEICSDAGYSNDSNSCYIYESVDGLEEGESGAIPPTINEQCVPITICFSETEMTKVYCMPHE